jgi:uncharacterized protein (DUF362 family)/Pyruvate/2-oxoacid:ferredoxin oxidoreductase delta subunit
MTVVAIDRCRRYEKKEVACSVGRVLDAALGGKPDLAGRRVLVKPNLAAARSPERAVTTHPAVVAAVLDYLADCGAETAVGDSPAGALRGVERVWENTGMLDLCREKGVRLVNFEVGGWVERTVDGRTYEMAAALQDYDLVVSLPKLKTHILTLLSCAVKNAFGCMPGFRKAALHLDYPQPDRMSVALVDIFSLVRPWVSVVDAVDSMEGNGPSSGRVVHTGLVAAGTDAVAVDSALGAVVGLAPHRVPTTREADRRGMGVADLERMTFPLLGPGDIGRLRFKVPRNWRFFLIPGFLGRALSGLVWVRPRIDRARCVGCGDCVGMCAAGAISLDSGKARIDEQKCRSCLCCHEACFEGAVRTRLSRLARLIA